MNCEQKEHSWTQHSFAFLKQPLTFIKIVFVIIVSDTFLERKIIVAFRMGNKHKLNRLRKDHKKKGKLNYKLT